MKRKSKIKNQKSKIRWLAFTAVILIAFFFRFYRLPDHPLGIFFDPAINGLDAVRLMQRGGPALFFPPNGGREPLFVYLLIPYLWLFGTTPFSIRLLTATIGLLTVALLFGFLYQLPKFSPESKTAHRFTRIDSEKIDKEYQESLPSVNHWLATLGSLALAVSYWHIFVSRLGLRPILVPMLSIPLFWFFLRGWTTGQKRWFILSGLFMGLQGYTYSAARILPLILVLALLPELLRPSFPLLKRGGLGGGKGGSNLLIFVLAALIIYLPMAWYLLTHPAQFTARPFSVMVWNFLDTPADIIAEIGRNTLRVAGFFCCAGSPNPIFGLPGYPGLHPLLTPLLLVGLIGTLKNWPHLFYRLIALWWLIGLISSTVAIEAPHPLRMIVAVVPTAILVALGPIYLSDWLQEYGRWQVYRFTHRVSRLTPHALRILYHVLRFTPPTRLLWLSLILILLPTPSLFRAYFIDWTQLQATQGIYDYGAVAIRDTVLEHAGNNIPIYLPLARFNDPTLLFQLSGPFRRQAALTVSSGDQALVIAPQQNEKDSAWVRLHHQVATVLPPFTAEGQQLIQRALAEKSASPVRTISGETVAHSAYLPTDPAHFLQQPTRRLIASFGPARLTGINYPPVIMPAPDKLPVTLFWQATARMADEYEVILHLVDDSHRAWGNGDARPTGWVYPTPFWRPGLDEIADQHNVVVGTDTLPPGRYWLAVSLLDPATNQRLPLTEGESASPDTVFIGPLKVPLPPVPTLKKGEESGLLPLKGKGVTFGHVARLSSFRIDNPTIAAGEPVNLTLLWEALATPELDYTVFVHLLDANDNIVAGNDTQPVANRYPTSIWSPGERVLDRHTLPTPASLPTGQYHLAIGLYYQPSGERLPLNFVDGRQDGQGRLILTQPVTVRKKR